MVKQIHLKFGNTSTNETEKEENEDIIPSDANNTAERPSEI